MRRVFLAFGSNLGDRRRNIESAIAAIEKADVHIIERSSMYETEPMGFADQPWFVNMVVAAETRWFPIQLLTLLQRTERELGRVRSLDTTHNGPRTIDIDILIFGKAVIETPQLRVPHPRMCERRFVLEPLVEIAPDLRHPVTGLSFSQCLKALTGQRIRKLE